MKVIEELERLEKAATDGPWITVRDNDSVYAGRVVAVPDGKWACDVLADPDGDDRPADREFVCALRNAAPALLAVVKAVEAWVPALDAYTNARATEAAWLAMRDADARLRKAFTDLMGED